jgi:hypothetical protein
MLDISVQIQLNDKADLESLKTVLKRQGIEKPIYIIELANGFQIDYESEYHSTEIEYDLLPYFPDYEFAEYVGSGQLIRMIISNTQSPMSTDNWGRPFNSDSIETTKYLVKKANEESTVPTNPNPTFKVMFGDIEKEYTVNIVPGVNRATNQEGFIVVKTKTEQTEKPDLLITKLFTDKTSAFWSGYHKLTVQIDDEFEEDKKTIKRKRKKK